MFIYQNQDGVISIKNTQTGRVYKMSEPNDVYDICATLNDKHGALVDAEKFIAGFEDDESQDGIESLLGTVRACIIGS